MGETIRLFMEKPFLPGAPSPQPYVIPGLRSSTMVSWLRAGPDLPVLLMTRTNDLGQARAWEKLQEIFW
jgi:hypothetical protein